MITRAKVEGDVVQIDIEACRRCNGPHIALVAKPFELPHPIATHWVNCPTTLEPILINPKGRGDA